jgi:hypothetical protein
MEMSAELPASFDCRATAAVLRSGVNVTLAGQIAAVMSVLPMWKGGAPAWIAYGSVLVWCVAVYLGIRVKIDAQFFELLGTHPAGQLDDWLKASGLRKNTRPRTIADRRRGALRLWRALVAVVTVQIALLLLALLRLLA